MAINGNKVLEMNIKNTLLLALLLLVVACSPAQDELAEKPTAKQAIFDTQLQALEDSKKVEAMLQQAADKQRKAVIEQTE